MAKIVSATDLVTLDEAKAQLRIEHNEDDTLLAALIMAATIHMSSYLRAPVSDGTWTQSFQSGKIYLCLHEAAIDPIEVTYRDLEGVDQNFADFRVESDGDVSVISAPTGWPDATSFTVTYGVAAPFAQATLKVAALMHVAALYENPTATSDGKADVLPLGYKELIAPFRRF